MLSELFGGETTYKCLVYLAAMGEGYPLEISRALSISNTQVIRTLNKLEQGDIVVGRDMGRTRLYSLNPNFFVANELKALLNRIIASKPVETESVGPKRRRARKMGRISRAT